MICNLENIELLFQKMNENNIDVTAPKKWGFYFYNRDKEPLNKVWKELMDHDYKLEKLERSEATWKLVVTKIDVLTPLKLHKRNLAFNELAEFCGADQYDGWDVEKL